MGPARRRRGAGDSPGSRRSQRPPRGQGEGDTVRGGGLRVGGVRSYNEDKV